MTFVQIYAPIYSLDSCVFLCEFVVFGTILMFGSVMFFHCNFLQSWWKCFKMCLDLKICVVYSTLYLGLLLAI